MIWLFLLVALWIVWGVTLFLVQGRMVFPGRSAGALEGSGPAGAELHRLELPGGHVEAWWLPPAVGARRPAPAVLFTHGNFELVDEWVGSFERVRAAGAGVLLLEFPGYGRSTGVANEATVTAASVAAWDLLASMTGVVDRERIVALGRSVGGAPACALTRQRPVAALVLHAAFTGLRPYARRYLLPGFLVREPFDNQAAVHSFAGPVLVQHGSADRTVPFVHGERLAAAARDGRLLRYECGHNDCPWDRMIGDMLAFLREHAILD